MLSPQEIRTRKSSQDAIDVPVEFIDSTCYFITAAAFDTLLQCTSSHSPTRDNTSSSPPRTDRANLWTSSTNFFTGSLVCTDPPLILATGNAVSVLERDWQNYFVLLDLNNVAPYGRLPSLFSTFSSYVLIMISFGEERHPYLSDSVHAISKGYPLGSFGEIHWILLGLSPLRNHIPTREPRAGGKRWRSNSLPSPQTPDDAYPELNPSLSVTFDLNQATNNPSPPSPNSTTASRFFTQAPTRSIHSLVRARLQCLFATSTSSPFSITVRLFFGSTSNDTNSWRMDEGMIIAMNDGTVGEEDSWLLGGHGQPYLVSDKEYAFTIVAGLAADGVYHTPAATFNKLRLIRRWSDWSHQGDAQRMCPQAYVEIADATDPRITFSLGPVAFDPSGIQGKEWVGVIPPCIEC
ncbi:hypothetical protein M408DRAFT_28419 [Serendipita vermifera MAFF 305830]|uniref:Uncharacterized protein n=1 Tax=Serendipita vermifera MAFF 305830 TaxID=933852 RepID=A0A0C2WZQ8_SERVB|nr:hypothetical protein M408DRAFT_28419 [Serendipita vermifera MAFF 305830]